MPKLSKPALSLPLAGRVRAKQGGGGKQFSACTPLPEPLMRFDPPRKGEGCLRMRKVSEHDS
jgi:hypothetical protein